MTLLMRDQENIEKGRKDINRLNSILISSNRMEDLKRSVEDEKFQKQLIEELLSEDT